MPKIILFTGGGTTGHITKNLILIELIRNNHPDIDIHYAGLKSGPEYKLIHDLYQLPVTSYQLPVLEPGVTFHSIMSGKLRRYPSLTTITDFFRFLIGIIQSYRLIRRLKPHIIFSSGGYVALPVGIAAWLYKNNQRFLHFFTSSLPHFVISRFSFLVSHQRPVTSNQLPALLTHETDSYPGLTTRILAYLGFTVLLGYESAKKHLPKSAKLLHVGNPVNPSLMISNFLPCKACPERSTAEPNGGRCPDEEGTERSLVGTKPNKKLNLLGLQILFITGGSQGSQFINDAVEEILDRLVLEFNIIHQTGEGKSINFNHPNYRQVTTVSADEYASILKSASLIITRGGGNTLSEIAAISSLQTAVGSGQSENQETKNIKDSTVNTGILNLTRRQSINTSSQNLTQTSPLPPPASSLTSRQNLTQAPTPPPSVLIIPVPSSAGNHQYHNAVEMQKQFPEWVILNQSSLTPENLLIEINRAKHPRRKQSSENAAGKILEIIISHLAERKDEESSVASKREQTHYL